MEPAHSVEELNIQIPADHDEHARLRAQERRTEAELANARDDEAAHHTHAGTWDAVREQPVPIQTTWFFWKGDDWTAEEKRALSDARNLLAVGLAGSLSTLAVSAVGIAGAKANLDAAEARLATANVTSPTGEVNADLLTGAKDNLGTAIGGTIATALALLTAAAAGAYKYYTVVAAHAEKVDELNKPDVTKERERLEQKLDYLRQRLQAEEHKLALIIDSGSQAQTENSGNL